MIDESGRYKLVSDLQSSRHDRCVVITTSDVIINGLDHTVGGNGTTGVAVTGETRLTNITVKNIKVSGWEFGVRYNWTAGGRIENVTATGNSIHGIRLENTEETLVTHNVAARNRFAGISLSESPGNQLRSNVVRGNTDGIAVTDNSNGTVVKATTADTNSNQGIFVWGSENVTVEQSTILSTPRGISVMGSPGITLVRNELSQNIVGISVQGSNRVSIRNITVTDGKYGIRLRFVNNGTISDSIVKSVEFHGIDMFYTSRMTVKYTAITTSGFNGINLRESSHNVLLRNIINDNEGTGIVLVLDSDNNRILQNDLDRNERGILIALSSNGNELTKNSVNSNQSS